MVASHMACSAPDRSSGNATLGIGYTADKRKTNNGQDDDCFTHEDPRLIKRVFHCIRSGILPVKTPTRRQPDSPDACLADPANASKDQDTCRLQPLVPEAAATL